jgi:hypothetical protein
VVARPSSATKTNVLHALCNAPHLRELKALVQIEKEDWARRMQRLLRRACHATKLAHEQGVPLKRRLIALIERCYDTVLAEGKAFHEAQPALAKPGRRDGLGTTFYSASAPESRTCSGSSPIPACPSPTTLRNATDGPEDFRRLLLRARRQGFWPDSVAVLDSQKARLGYAQHTDQSAGPLDQRPTRGLTPVIDVGCYHCH